MAEGKRIGGTTAVLAVLVAVSLALNGYLLVRTADPGASESPQIDSLRGDIASLQGAVNALSLRLEVDEGRIAALEQRMSGNEADLADLEARVAQLEAQVSALESSVDALRARIDALEAGQAAQDTAIASLQGDVSALQATVSSLTSAVAGLDGRIASLEPRVAFLEANRPLVVRISFVSFAQDVTPAGGADWLIDIELTGGGCLASGRTGHSRFVVPRYLDLSANRTACAGLTVTLRVYAYWHLNDALIDIDPNAADGRCGLASPTNPAGCYLTVSYAIGTTLTGSVDGNADGYLLDAYDGQLQYRVETLP